MLNLFAAVLASTVALAQADTNHDHLKAAEAFIGTWRHEEVRSTDSPQVKKGDTVVTQWTFAWTADKNALSIGQFISVNGKTVGRLDSIFGWDKRQQQIIGAGFATNGVASSGWMLSPEDGKLEIAAGSSVWVVKTQANDTLVLEDADRASTEYRRIASQGCSE